MSTINVADELANTLDLIHYQFRKRAVDVRRELAAEARPVLADRQQLRQLFLNLLTNALDAMPQGGTLTLRLRPAGAGVVIEVSDTGIGIPPEHLARVTEPFFTTKEEGKGTGLGLAICKRIVQEHGGSLAVESTVGHGTTVRIELPAEGRFDPAHWRDQHQSTR